MYLLCGLLLLAGTACGAFGDDDGGTDGPAETPTAEPAGQPPEEALRLYVERRLNQGFVADCDDAQRPDDVGKQCASFRGERGDLRAFELGPTFSEYTRLIILEPAADGWTIAHLENRNPDDPPAPGVPWPLEVGANVVIAGTDPSCLRIRERPGTLAPELACLEDGIVVRIAEGPVNVDELQWWRLEAYGWAASNWLRYPEDVPELPTIEPGTTPDGEPAGDA
jgi:hypothetical protein